MANLKLPGQVFGLAMILALLPGCNTPASTPELPAITPISQATITLTEPAPTVPASVTFPLSQPGPYFAGNRVYTLVDQSRNGREIQITLWYPALETVDSLGRTIMRDAAPDTSAAPYPLVITGPNSGDMLFQSHLASHGFVMAIVRFPDFRYTDDWNFYVIDNPQDILYALDQISTSPPPGLEGVVDTDRTGVAGYSSDGLFSLALSGVRIDPQAYLSYCQQGPVIEPAYGAEWYYEYTCSLAQQWQEFTSYVGDDITASDDGLWQPVTDPRILAVMPMAPDGGWLYGERGMATTDRPLLMIAGTQDDLIPYQSVTVDIYTHLGTPDKSLISMIGKTHMGVLDSDGINKIRHFATAFFGYHLQGRQEYLEFISQDFVSQFSDLAWGIYEGD
jgi:predicted dienelactone hydrolase